MAVRLAYKSSSNFSQTRSASGKFFMFSAQKQARQRELDLFQGAKKIILTACHSSKLKLAFTSPHVISTSPKSFLTSRIDFTVLLLFEFLKNITCPSGRLKTEFTSPIAKSTSPGLSDTTFFARCVFPAKNRLKSCHFVANYLRPCRVRHRQLSKYVKTNKYCKKFR